MWPLLVVLVSPGADPSAGVKQVPEPTDIQALIAQLSMEALNVPVLSQFFGLNVNRAWRPAAHTKTDSDDWLVPARCLNEYYQAYRAVQPIGRAPV
jgi:hypothetical protein